MAGCAHGVASLERALPGHSHNDIKSANFLVHDPLSEDGGDDALADAKATREAVPAPAVPSGGGGGGEGPTARRQRFIVKLADLEFCSKVSGPEGAAHRCPRSTSSHRRPHTPALVSLPNSQGKCGGGC